MTKLVKSELVALKGAEPLNKLSDLAPLLSAASRTIDNFVAYSGRRLKGEGYDAIRTYLAYYVSAFTKLSTFDTNAHDNIKHGTINLVSFMEDYDLLDDSRLETLANGLNYIGKQIGNLEWNISHNNYTEEELPSKQAALSYYYGEYYKILKEYNKLKELAPKAVEVAAIVDAIEADMAFFRKHLIGYPQASGGGTR